MEATKATFQHSYGLGPRGPDPHYRAQQDQGPHHPPPAPGPPGAPRPEEPQHHKPFFYIQPSQPYMPMQSMQWPVPVPMHYNPYYPGLGYGVPMMPHYQPNPYMEPPGFVVPTTHLHLMDYRRMLNPQYYQTMAYHSRRFRYQQNSQTREMTSAQVQTEPLRTNTPGPSGAGAPGGGLPVRGGDGGPGVSAKQQPPPSPAPSVQKGAPPPAEPKDATAPSSSARTTTTTPPSGGFVIQTEEVRIECCATPAGMQLLHAHETAEVSHSFSQDLVQRSSSSSVLQGRVVRQDEGRRLPSEPVVQACPDILLVGETTLPSLEEESEEESRNQTDPAIVSRVSARDDVQEASGEKDPSKDFHFKVVHLPFDPEYLDELWKMESTVWSTKEETVTPSPESPNQDGRPESGDSTTEDTEDTEEVVTAIQMPTLAEEEQEDVVPAVEERSPDEMPEADSFMDVPVAEESPTTALALAAEEEEDDDSTLKADENVQDQQDTSFESLPAYLPSTSWLADFDNVYYRSEMPPTPKKRNRPAGGRGSELPARRRKLDLDHDEDRPAASRKPKERLKPKGKADRRSLSDHDCRLEDGSFDENESTPRASSKRERRLCSRCVAATATGAAVCGPGPDGRAWKRKAALFQQWSDAVPLPTCDACKGHHGGAARKRRPAARKGSSPEVRGRDTEGEESSENGSCRFGSKPNNLGGMPLASRQNVDAHPRLREKNCACSESQQQRRTRHCPHGNAIREADENRSSAPVSLLDKRRIMDQIYLTHRWQTACYPPENAWKAVMPNPDGDGAKNDARAPHFIKHKNSQPRSQGNCRKDTRC